MILLYLLSSVISTVADQMIDHENLPIRQLFWSFLAVFCFFVLAAGLSRLLVVLRIHFRHFLISVVLLPLKLTTLLLDGLLH